MRDVVYSYQNMNDSQQTAVRAFLGLDRDQPKCIFLHDKMFHGVVEAPRATYGIAARGSSMSEQMNTPPRTPRESDLSEIPNTPTQSYLTPSANGTPSETSIPPRPPLAKRSVTTPITSYEINSASKYHRKTAYRVKVVSSSSVFGLPVLAPPTPIRNGPIPEGFNESLSIMNESDVKAALVAPSVLSSTASEPNIDAPTNQDRVHNLTRPEASPQHAKGSTSKSPESKQKSNECCVIA